MLSKSIDGIVLPRIDQSPCLPLPSGMTIENMVGDACDPAQDAFDFALTSPVCESVTLDATEYTDSRFTWSGLTFGTYSLSESPLPDGYTSYFIPGSVAVGGSGDGGYTVAIDETAPSIGLSAYNFQPEITGSIKVLVYGCPRAMTSATSEPNACTPISSGWDVTLFGEDFPNEISSVDGSVFDAGVTWYRLSLGTYGVIESVLPGNYSDYLVTDSPRRKPIRRLRD